MQSKSLEVPFSHLKNIARLRPSLSFSAAETLIHASITLWSDYCNSVFLMSSTNSSTSRILSASCLLTRQPHHPYLAPQPMMDHLQSPSPLQPHRPAVVLVWAAEFWSCWPPLECNGTRWQLAYGAQEDTFKNSTAMCLFRSHDQVTQNKPQRLLWED